VQLPLKAHHLDSTPIPVGGWPTFAFFALFQTEGAPFLRAVFTRVGSDAAATQSEGV